MNAMNLPHRPTFPLEEQRGHKKPSRCRQVEQARVWFVVMHLLDDQKTRWRYRSARKAVVNLLIVLSM